MADVCLLHLDGIRLGQFFSFAHLCPQTRLVRAVVGTAVVKAVVDAGRAVVAAEVKAVASTGSAVVRVDTSGIAAADVTADTSGTAAVKADTSGIAGRAGKEGMLNPNLACDLRSTA